MTPEEFGLSLVGATDAQPEIQELAALIADHRSDEVPDLLELFDRVVTDYAPRRINDMLRYLRADSGAEIPFGSTRFLLLAADPNFSLGLSIIDHNPRYLYWHPSHTWYRRLDRTLSPVRRYLVPDTTENDVVDRSVQLALAETDEFGVGKVLVRDGRREVIDFEMEPNAPIVLIRLQLALMGGLEWMFDRGTLGAVGATSLQPNHSHLMSLVHAASLLGDESSVDALRSALTHPSHAVRWATVQAIGRLDRTAALGALAGLAGDPHPHVRTAARNALERATACAAA